jgi:hypothetical protein
MELLDAYERLSPQARASLVNLVRTLTLDRSAPVRTPA